MLIVQKWKARSTRSVYLTQQWSIRIRYTLLHQNLEWVKLDSYRSPIIWVCILPLIYFLRSEHHAMEWKAVSGKNIIEIKIRMDLHPCLSLLAQFERNFMYCLRTKQYVYVFFLWSTFWQVNTMQWGEVLLMVKITLIDWLGKSSTSH